jgi:hypothetical protein
VTCGRFSPVSSTNKTDCYDITEKLLKVALNTIKQNPKPQIDFRLALPIDDLYTKKKVKYPHAFLK